MLEAQAAGRIAHPNIIEVLDLGIETSDGSLYMVQELLHGEDLRARLRAAGKLAPREALELLVPVVGALAAAHEDGVVHREQSRSDGRRVSRMRQLGAAQR
jgi:serine/threonine protein kinase